MTPDSEMKPLVERLRAVESSGSHLGICTNWYRNPDGPEAATTILRLEGEIAALREALHEAEKHFGPFADITINGRHDPDDVRVVALIRTALKDTSHG